MQIDDILKALPSHEGELSITHNGHKSNYETVKDYLEWMKADDEDFATPESKQKMIDSNEIWECQWYPNTPIGFNRMYAESLKALLEALKKVNN